MTNYDPLNEAITHLRVGGVIAYPTESVYGFGCDPFNPDAVTRILLLKRRSIKKGFIVIASDWEQLEPFVEPIDPQALAHVFASWPGAITWAFPATPDVPIWVRGQHTSVAVRITNHPIAKSICERFGKPIISTSANIEGHPPVCNAKMLDMTFGEKVDFIVDGKVGDSHRPTEIRDAITGEVLRSA